MSKTETPITLAALVELEATSGKSFPAVNPDTFKATVVRTNPDYPADTRWNYHFNRYERREYNHEASSAKRVGEGRLYTEADKTPTEKEVNGKIEKVYLLNTAKIVFAPVYDEWKVDTEKMKGAPDKIDDKHFVRTYLGLYDKTGMAKEYASIAYLAKRWRTSTSLVKRQRTKIINAFKKHFPNKTILPEDLRTYTSAEKTLSVKHRNEAIHTADNAEDFLSAFGLKDTDFAKFNK